MQGNAIHIGQNARKLRIILTYKREYSKGTQRSDFKTSKIRTKSDETDK